MDTVERVEQADLAVARRVTADRHPLVRLAGKASELADQPPLRALTLGTIAVGLARGDGRLARAGARMFAAHTLATWMKDRVKVRIDRTRPETARDEGYRAGPGEATEHAVTSFPSGHTAGALAVTLALARDYPSARDPGLVLTAAVAAVQLPRAKHFLSDVIAGAAIGWAADRIVGRVLPGRGRD